MKFHKLISSHASTTSAKIVLSFSKDKYFVKKTIVFEARELIGKEIGELKSLEKFSSSYIAQNIRYFQNKGLGVKLLVNLDKQCPDVVADKLISRLYVRNVEKYVTALES